MTAEGWVLTRENLNEIDDRIGSGGLARQVARFGDTVRRSPRGKWSVVAARAAEAGDSRE